MTKLVVIFCFAVCVTSSLWAMAIGDGGQFALGAICFVASFFIYIPMLEELDSEV